MFTKIAVSCHALTADGHACQDESESCNELEELHNLWDCMYHFLICGSLYLATKQQKAQKLNRGGGGSSNLDPKQLATSKDQFAAVLQI